MLSRTLYSPLTAFSFHPLVYVYGQRSYVLHQRLVVEAEVHNALLLSFSL